MVEVISGHYIEILGHRMFFDTAGDDIKNKPMVLIHTAGQHAIQWRFTMPYFAAKGYYVIAPDLPGHGKSLLKDFKPIISVHEYSEVIWSLIKALNIKCPIIMGCSLGGDIAIDLAVNHSSSLKAAVVCEAAGKNQTVPKEVVEMGLEDSGIPSFCDGGSLGGLSACGTQADKARVEEIVWTRRAGDPKIYYSDLKAWISHDVTHKLNEISCPVLIIRGEDDYYLPEKLAKDTSEAISGAILINLKGVGHYPHIETDVFNGIVDEYLNDIK